MIMILELSTSTNATYLFPIHEEMQLFIDDLIYAYKSISGHETARVSVCMIEDVDTSSQPAM